MYRWNGAEMSYPAIFPKKAGETLKIATLTQLKVLIWMATCDQKDVDAKAAAAALGGRVTEADCADALAFWEKEGVLLLDEGLPAATEPAQTTPLPQNEEEKEKAEDESSPASEATSVPKPAPAIKTLTAADADKAKKDRTHRKEFFQQLHAVEARFGKTLSPTLQNDLQNLAEKTSLPTEVFLMVVNYAARNDKANFKYIKKITTSWEKKGFNTVDAVDQYLCHLERREKAWNILVGWLALEVSRPTSKQKDLADKWIFEFGQSQSLIALANDFCIKNTEEKKFNASYIDTILETWHEEGITSPSQVKPSKKFTPIRYNASAEKSDCGFDYDKLEKLIAGHTPRFRKKES